MFIKTQCTKRDPLHHLPGVAFLPKQVNTAVLEKAGSDVKDHDFLCTLRKIWKTSVFQALKSVQQCGFYLFI